MKITDITNEFRFAVQIFALQFQYITTLKRSFNKCLIKMQSSLSRHSHTFKAIYSRMKVGQIFLFVC